MTDPTTYPAPGLPPAGWYHDGTGLRWWDGSAWGPYAPAAPVPWVPADPVAAGSTMSVFCHLGFFFLAVILPLIMRLTEGKKNDYVRHHSTEALNFQLTFLAVWITGFVTIFVTAIATAPDAADDGSGSAWVVLPFLIMFVAYGVGAVFSVLGAVRASQGIWWRYPISIRFVRGATRRPS